VREIIQISTFANGGIKTVVNNYMHTNNFNDYKFYWIHTHDNSSLIKRLFLFIRSLLIITFKAFGRKKIFHIHMAMRGSFFRKFIIVVLLKPLKHKTIIHLHGSEFKDFYNHSSSIIKRLIKFVFENVDDVIVLSNSWKIFILSIAPGSNVFVVNNYVEQVPFIKSSESCDEGKIIFSFFGAIGDRKGIFDLIKAFKNVLPILDNCELHVYGDGKINEAKALCQELGIDFSTKFHGWTAGKNKNIAMNRSDVIILPSYNEGLPMVILEAFSISKPVISTYVGGIPEVIENGENGILINPGDIESLTRSMVELASNPKLREYMGANAYNSYSFNFSPNVILPKLRDIYES
jgi:polysaccharide biosynthesis protein VpsI